MVVNNNTKFSNLMYNTVRKQKREWFFFFSKCNEKHIVRDIFQTLMMSIHNYWEKCSAQRLDVEEY